MKITDFTLYPLRWGTQDCESYSGNSGSLNVLEFGCCAVCNCVQCCCKGPVVCAGSLVTCPIGATTGLIYSALGLVAAPILLVADAVNDTCCVPNDEINSITATTRETYIHISGAHTDLDTQETYSDVPYQSRYSTIN